MQTSMMHSLLFLKYIEWHFIAAPKEILKGWGNILWFGFNYFSVPLLLKTLFAPWRRITWSYGRGFDPGRYLYIFVESHFANTGRYYAHLSYCGGNRPRALLSGAGGNFLCVLVSASRAYSYRFYVWHLPSLLTQPNQHCGRRSSLKIIFARLPCANCAKSPSGFFLRLFWHFSLPLFRAEASYL